MFAAINYINCGEEYTPRFEDLIDSRAKVADLKPGFKIMEELKPFDKNGNYLIISHGESEQ